MDGRSRSKSQRRARTDEAFADRNTLDIYAQHVPESQERAVAKMVEMVAARRHAQFKHLKTEVVN